MHIYLQRYLTAEKPLTGNYYPDFYRNTITGKEVTIYDSNSLFYCIVSCQLSNTTCNGVIFCNDAIDPLRCHHIYCGSAQINWASMSNCNLYMRSYDIKIPKLYFPLDGIGSATALGQASSNVQFVVGKVCNTFYNPLQGSIPKSYLNLGHFPETEFCFPEPQKCELGVTFSFWLNILGTTGEWQGIITTMPQNGPGFYAAWYESYGLMFDIRQGTDTVEEWIRISTANFYDDIGYGTWKHFVITYLFDGTNLGNNMDVYMGGKLRPDDEKITSSWDEPNTEGYHGDLELAQYWLGYGYDYGYIKLDQLMIWEERLNHDEVEQLMDMI